MTRSVLVAVALLAGCTSSKSQNLGEATATIKQVPAGVLCLQIQVVGSTTISADFSVSPGQSSIVSMGNLPIGADTFTAVAFDTACDMTMGATATWASDPVMAVVAAGAVTPVELTMHVAGGSASIGVDFPDDGGAPPSDLAPPMVDMGCVPMDKTTACMGATCGSAPNGCGGIISCGTCGGSMVCCGDTCMPGKLCN